MGTTAPASDSDSRDSDGRFTYVESATSSYLTPAEAGARRALDATPPGSPATSPRAAPAHFSGLPRFPSIIWHANPSVKLKLRKRFYPLGLTRLTLGADLDVRTRDVAFKWSWKDRFIGGRLQFEANQISFTKHFDVDDRTRLDVRAAFDTHTRRTLFSLGVKPFRGITANTGAPDGLSIKQKIPIDKHVAVELHARVQIPEARFSNTSTSAVSLGEGNFVVDLDQVNFRFMLH